MKWWEILGAIVTIGVLAQLLKWVLDSLEIQRISENTFTFLLAIIFTILMVIILILNQLQSEITKMKEFLKIKGYQNNGGFIEKLVKMKYKKGMLDSRILWIVIVAVIIYLLYKARIFG